MDLLEHLADVAVPPVPGPRAFAEGVRRKLYPRLLALHVVEFACGAMGWAMLHFLVALFAAVRYTVTGSWPPPTDRGDGRAER